jgi:hypothetical protein
MTVPTRTELHAEVDRLFREQHPDAPAKLDPKDPDQSDLVHAWLAIRDKVANEWTNKVFFEHFPAAGKLDPTDPGDQQLIDYWLDIRNLIRDGTPSRYNWDGPAGTTTEPEDVGSTGTDSGYPLTLNMSIPWPLEWAEGVPPVTTIAKTFRDEYNLRLSSSVYTGPTAILGSPLSMGTTDEEEEVARERSLNRIADIAISITTADQQENFWDAYYRVALTSSIEARAILHPLIDGGPGVPVVSDAKFPVSVVYLAKRPGMMLAWLDAAILKATATETERIQILKDAQKAQNRVVSLLTAMPIWPDVPGVIADTVSIILGEVEPDLDREFANYKAALAQFRYTCERVAQSLFLASLQEGTSGVHPEIGVLASAYKAYVLLGWDDEMRFLGLS